MFKLKKRKTKFQLIRENRNLIKKINTLELEIDVLKNQIKDKFYENFGIDTQKDEVIESQKKQIKNQKQKIKLLKEMLENGSSRTAKRIRETKTTKRNA